MAQHLVIDGLLYPLVYETFDTEGQATGGTVVSLLCEFMTIWYPDHQRWVDAIIKTTAKESDDNKALLSKWFGAWRDATAEALRPLSAHVLDGRGDEAVDAVTEALNVRAAKLGLTV